MEYETFEEYFAAFVPSRGAAFAERAIAEAGWELGLTHQELGRYITMLDNEEDYPCTLSQIIARMTADMERYEADMEMRDGFLSDAEADADVLAGIGWGTDEDYGYFGDDY